jgi:mRNA-degrading endonuclease RelE of RelBE toxin-antitoxin system
MYHIKYTTLFKRNLKKLIKKYPRINRDLSNLFDQLENGEFHGDELQGFVGSVYKVRIGSIDQKKGKRGGFRIVYLIVTAIETVHLLTIYAKAQQEDLSHQQKQDLKFLIEELNKLESE